MPMQRVSFKVNPQPFRELEAQNKNLLEFIDKRRLVFDRVCKKCTPLVRRLLLDSYSASGIHNITGDLKSWIGQSIFYCTKRGILRIGPPKGRKPEDYVKMAALQYGAVRNSGITSSKVKAAIKKTAFKTGLSPSGVVVIKAHKYYVLNGGQMNQLEAEFNKYLQEEVNRVLKPKGK